MAEYCIKGETKNGRTVIVRRGFVSKTAAEDHPVQLSNWQRVWVEPVSKPKPAPKPDQLRPKDRAYQAILAAAIKRERCPENGQRGLSSGIVRRLANDGLIKVEVFARNYRVVTILTGKHAGKRTKGPPYKVQHPKLEITKEGRRVFRVFKDGRVQALEDFKRTSRL
jgi:hypothetical protein